MLVLSLLRVGWILLFFFFNDTATTEIYTLSLHDALPISSDRKRPNMTNPSTSTRACRASCAWRRVRSGPDRKSTRLNSSHDQISYAVFCLKKKNWSLRCSCCVTTSNRRGHG